MSLFKKSQDAVSLSQNNIHDALKEIFQTNNLMFDDARKIYESLLIVNKKSSTENYIRVLESYGRFLEENNLHEKAAKQYLELIKKPSWKVKIKILERLVKQLFYAGEIKKSKDVLELLLNHLIKVKNIMMGRSMLEFINRNGIPMGNIERYESIYDIISGQIPSMEAGIHSLNEGDYHHVEKNIHRYKESKDLFRLVIKDNERHMLNAEDCWSRREHLKKIYNFILRYPEDQEGYLRLLSYYNKTVQNERKKKLDEILFMSESQTLRGVVASKEYENIRKEMESEDQVKSLESKEEYLEKKLILLASIERYGDAKKVYKELAQINPSNKLVQAAKDKSTLNGPQDKMNIEYKEKGALVSEYKRIITKDNFLDILAHLFEIGAYEEINKLGDWFEYTQNDEELRKEVKCFQAKAMFVKGEYYKAIDVANELLNMPLNEDELAEILKIKNLSSSKVKRGRVRTSDN